MAEIKDYSTTAANNNSASPAGWPEAMAPSGLNDSDRELAARVARLYADTNGSLVTTGTEPAYALAANRTISAYADGDMFRFRCHATNESATKSPSVITSINVDGLGAKEIVSADSVELAAYSLTTGGIYTIVYSSIHGKFVCLDYEQRSPAITVFTSDGTWTKSAGMQRIIVDCIGGGGGGGGSATTSANQAGAGAGGGGGGYGYEVLRAQDVTDTVTVTVGTGGAGGAIGTTGDTGTTTSFGAYVTAAAGTGGASLNAGTDLYHINPGTGGNFSLSYNSAGAQGSSGHVGLRVGSNVETANQRAWGGTGGTAAGPFGGGGLRWRWEWRCYRSH
jgi:hypothetical protein